jgi:hypothetical protein
MTTTVIVTRMYRANEVPANKDLKLSRTGFNGGYHIGVENKPLAGLNETNIAVTKGSTEMTVAAAKTVYRPMYLITRMWDHF